MQCMTSDYRTVAVWRRVEPSDGDERGDAVATYEKQSKRVRAGFVPVSVSLQATDSSTTRYPSLWKVFVSYVHPFAVGDRMGPADAEEPDMEVVTVRDFAGDQILEVRPLD